MIMSDQQQWVNKFSNSISSLLVTLLRELVEQSKHVLLINVELEG